MGKLESDVMSGIKRRLEHYEFAKIVVWWTRLQSFKIKHFGNWIHGCAKGTSDFVAVIRNKHNNLTVVFLEAKSDTGKLRPEQIQFRDKHHNGHDVLYCEIRDPKEVDNIINNIGIDTTQALPDQIG